MADNWENILSDKGFKALPIQDRVNIAHNFFKENIEADEGFQTLNDSDKRNIRTNFLKTLQEKSPTAFDRNVSAAYQTFKRVPRTITSGATLGLSEKAGELGIKAAGLLTGAKTDDRVSEFRKEYEQIPEISRTVGEFAGAAIPISKIGSLIDLGITKTAPMIGKVGANKMFTPSAKALSWAVAGSAYGAAEKGIKKGELPTAEELGKDAALWGGTEAIINSLGWGGRMVAATNYLSKSYGISKKEVLEAIFKQAKDAKEPIINIASQKEAAQKALKEIEYLNNNPMQTPKQSAIQLRGIGENFVNKIESLVNAQKRKNNKGYEALVNDLNPEGSIEKARAEQTKMFEGTQPKVTLQDSDQELAAKVENFLVGGGRQKVKFGEGEPITREPVIDNTPIPSKEGTWPPTKELPAEVEFDPIIKQYDDAISKVEKSSLPEEKKATVVDTLKKQKKAKAKTAELSPEQIERKQLIESRTEKDIQNEIDILSKELNKLDSQIKAEPDKNIKTTLKQVKDGLKTQIQDLSASLKDKTTNLNATGAVAGITGDENEPYDPTLGAVGAGISLFARGRKQKKYMDSKPNPTDREKVYGMYERSREVSEKRKSIDFSKAKDTFFRAVTDVGAKAKDMVKSVDPKLGREIEMRKNAISGAPAEGNRQFENIQRDVFKGLSKNEEHVLDMLVNARRNVEISSYNPNVVHQEGLTSDQFKKVIDDILSGNSPYGISKEKAQELYKRSDTVFNSYKDDLKQMYESGIINEESFNVLNEHIYSPRKFMQHLDELDKKITGRSLSSKESGIKALSEGSMELMETSSRELLHQSKMRTQDIIARNNANLALLKLADFKDNPVVRRAQIIKSTKDGKPIYESPARGSERISVIENGQRVEMIVPKELEQSWVKSDPLINHKMAQWIQWGTATKPVKMVATGYNPAFLLTNMPRDIAMVWTGGQYSRTLPVAIGQFAKNFASTAADAIRRKGRAIDYVKEGGGTELLTYYGQGNHIAPLNMAEKILGYIGSTSEIWTRLAHRERAINNLVNKFKAENNGRTPSQKEMKDIQFEATQIAREGSIDFSQGGNVIKALDNFIPYLNASVQGTRLLINNARKNPAAFSYQMAQLGMLGASLYYWNKNANPEALKQISDKDKANNFIFVIPDILPGVTSYIDDKGQKRNRFIKIAKEQSQQILIAPFEAVAEWQDTGKVPSKKIFESIKSLGLPYRVPVFSALTAIAGNVDDYEWKQIWTGARNIKPEEEWRKDTPKAFVKAGEITGLSPMRMQTAAGKIIPPNNPIAGSIGSITQLASGELSEELKRKGWNQFISENRGLRRLVSSTIPSNEYSQKVQEAIIEADTESFKQNRELDILADKYFKSKDINDYNKIANYVNSQESKIKDRLTKRYQTAFELKDYPDRDFWKIVKNAPAKAKAEILFDRMVSSSQEEQARIGKVSGEIKGILTPQVIEEYNKLVNKHIQDRKK